MAYRSKTFKAIISNNAGSNRHLPFFLAFIASLHLTQALGETHTPEQIELIMKNMTKYDLRENDLTARLRCDVFGNARAEVLR